MKLPTLLLPVIMMTQGDNAAPTWETWPPRDILVAELAADIKGILETQDAETGRFGTEPWICQDQNALYPLAAAWAVEHEDNPWFHDERLLEAIGKGGVALVDDQDADGKWIFRKKDNSTWGQIHMPWTYSRWIRAYELVGGALPEATRKRWEEGLLLGFGGIRNYMDGGVHNIPCHHAMALYIAGECFENEEWKQAAAGMMRRVVEHQDPGGYWSEHSGPVVGYNRVYVEAIGVYYHYSGDETVLPALERSARFHAAVLWPDGSSVSCIDERQIYHHTRDLGNVGFSHTPEGRGFLLRQLEDHVAEGHGIAVDYAASMLLHSSEGEGIAPAASADTGRQLLGDNDAVIERRKPWQWCLSGYACDPPQNRWIQDRHNLVDVYHDDLGLVIGGGNTKLQPYWSTFTVGDPSLLKHAPGDESPNFIPDIDLRWTPSVGHVDLSGELPRLDLGYGDVECSVMAEPRDDGSLALTYCAPADQGVEAHVPLLNRAVKLKNPQGSSLYLGEDEVDLAKGNIGHCFTYAGLKVALPEGARVRWPARQHNPYTKDGASSLSAAKLVVALPFEEGVSEQTILLSPYSPPPFDGIVLEARELLSRSDSGTRMKPLDGLGSQFLGAEGLGESITFTLPDIEPGTYDLSAEFVMASMYGIVQVLVDSEPVGEPVDGYCPGVDAEGEVVRIGPIDLGPGAHEVMLELVGNNEESTGHYISVKRWLLKAR